MFAQCRHFRGSQNACHANIEVESLRDAVGRLPCVVIRGVTGDRACDRRELPVEAVVAAGTMVTMLERMQSSRCPRCGEPINGEMELNDNIVALPCHHVIRHARD